MHFPPNYVITPSANHNRSSVCSRSSIPDHIHADANTSGSPTRWWASTQPATWGRKERIKPKTRTAAAWYYSPRLFLAVCRNLNRYRRVLLMVRTKQHAFSAFTVGSPSAHAPGLTPSPWRSKSGSDCEEKQAVVCRSRYRLLHGQPSRSRACRTDRILRFRIYLDILCRDKAVLEPRGSSKDSPRTASISCDRNSR